MSDCTQYSFISNIIIALKKKFNFTDAVWDDQLKAAFMTMCSTILKEKHCLSKILEFRFTPTYGVEPCTFIKKTQKFEYICQVHIKSVIYYLLYNNIIVTPLDANIKKREQNNCIIDFVPEIDFTNFQPSYDFDYLQSNEIIKSKTITNIDKKLCTLFVLADHIISHYVLILSNEKIDNNYITHNKTKDLSKYITTDYDSDVHNIFFMV